jgi:hypothetical protein
VSTLPPAPQPTEPATTTTEPGSPLQASDIPPVPILVRYEPQNKDEEELLAGAQDLLSKIYVLNHDARFEEAEYLEAFDEGFAKIWMDGQRKFRADGYDSTPGNEDRVVIESVERTSPTSGVLRTCDYDTAITWKREPGGEPRLTMTQNLPCVTKWSSKEELTVGGSFRTR